MIMDHKEVPTPEQIRQAQLAKELFADFEGSDFRHDFIPEGHSYVLVPDDNPVQANAAIELAQEGREHGKDYLIIKASRDESGHYTKFIVPPTFEPREKSS